MKHTLPMMLVLAGGLLAGCSQRRAYDAQVLRGETFTIGSPYLVMTGIHQPRPDEPGRSQADRSAPLPSGVVMPATATTVPWWQVRNEPWLNVRRGGQAGQWVEYQILSEDRQRSYGGRIRNYHRRTSRTIGYGAFLR